MECTCFNSMVSRHQKRISGPLLDRIDNRFAAPRVECNEPYNRPTGVDACPGERNPSAACFCEELQTQPVGPLVRVPLGALYVYLSVRVWLV